MSDTKHIDPADETQVETVNGAGDGTLSQEEFDYSPNPAGAEAEAAETTAEQQIQDENPRAPLEDELPSKWQQRFDAMERRNNELADELGRIRSAGAQTHVVEDQQPHENPTTWQEVQENMRWEIRRATQDMSRISATSASIASSEQRARGLLSSDAMGEGGDYDQMISRYIAPLEQKSPRFRELSYTMQDPALARYSIAIVLEAIDKNGGDPVKAMRQLRAAVTGRARQNAQVFDKIRQAEERGATRLNSRSRAGGGSGSPRAITAEMIDNMTNREYIHWKSTKELPARMRG